MEENKIEVVEMNDDGTNEIYSIPAEDAGDYVEASTTDKKIGVGTVICGISAVIGVVSAGKWAAKKIKEVVEIQKVGRAALEAGFTMEEFVEEPESEKEDSDEEKKEDPVKNFVEKRKEAKKEGK